MKNEFLKNLHLISSLIFSIVLWVACSSPEITIKTNEYGYEELPYAYYELPTAFKDIQLFERTILDYSNVLNNKIIFIDAGHGGEDRSNTSRDGSIVEADINLKVALHLRSFLQRCGTKVYMSRESDTTISLERRSEMANLSGADLFVSIHHNSTSDKSNYWTNYTSTFYHASPDNKNYSSYNQTAARYIQRDLAYALRNPGPLSDFDGTMSDYLINPGEGFVVLRETIVPAVLVECSFFTNRLEEKRLNLDQFNKVEAWGIFSGIAKFFKKNNQSIVLSEVLSKFKGNTLELVFELNDKSLINLDNFKFFLNDNQLKPESYTSNSNVLIRLTNPPVGSHRIKACYHIDENVAAKPLMRQIVIK